MSGEDVCPLGVLTLDACANVTVSSVKLFVSSRSTIMLIGWRYVFVTIDRLTISVQVVLISVTYVWYLCGIVNSSSMFVMMVSTARLEGVEPVGRDMAPTTNGCGSIFPRHADVKYSVVNIVDRLISY